MLPALQLALLLLLLLLLLPPPPLLLLPPPPLLFSSQFSHQHSRCHHLHPAGSANQGLVCECGVV
jgi:hypothetical protein